VHFIVKDISDLKALQRQLLQADKLASVGQLAAGIAHEINNPMGMILGYTQLLLREEPDGTGRYEDLKTIEKHARTCKTIVSDLLNFARRGRTHKEPADLHAVVDEVVSVLAHHFTLDGIRLVKDYDGTVPVMHFDIEKIRQVFMNLLMNARQAIGRQGEIRIRTRHEPAAGRVMIAVTDTGCGIDRQHVARVFDPFFTTKPTGEGTGLGLSVSYGIVSDHGGDITVESELGAGSTFTVQLPTPAAEVPAGK
jgi:signal transduction histidine kinase